jgi:hypothetical protein
MAPCRRLAPWQDGSRWLRAERAAAVRRSLLDPSNGEDTLMQGDVPRQKGMQQ